MKANSPLWKTASTIIIGMLLISSCKLENQQPDSSLKSVEMNAVESQDVATLTITPKPSLTPIALPTATPTISPTPTITATPLPPYPPEHYIRNITGHKQYFPLGCEAAAAVDWALFFGVPINEYEFQVKLPQSDNPDFGFVGGLQGPWGQVPPYSYGVHAGPVAALLREYGIPAVGLRGATLDLIKEQLSKDQPVIAWVIGNMVAGVPYEYTDKQGNKVIVAAYEHVVILTGYDEDSIRYMNNGKFYEIPEEIFLNSWGVLGNMIVMMEN